MHDTEGHRMVERAMLTAAAALEVRRDANFDEAWALSEKLAELVPGTTVANMVIALAMMLEQTMEAAGLTDEQTIAYAGAVSVLLGSKLDVERERLAGLNS